MRCNNGHLRHTSSGHCHQAAAVRSLMAMNLRRSAMRACNHSDFMPSVPY
jgi:hypothetical protein